MRFLLIRLINARRRITTTKNPISFLASCNTPPTPTPTSDPQSDSQSDHSASDPKPPPSRSEFGPNSLTCRLERLPRKESVLVAFQGWMRDGFSVHRGLIFHAINRLRRRRMYSRALQVMEWVIREKPYKVKDLEYSYLLEFTSKCHGISHAEKLFLTVPKLYQNELLYNNLVMACLDQRKIKLSYAYMRKMRELLLPISPFVYNRVILLHSAPSRTKSIPHILALMKADGIKPHTSTFNILLNIRATNHDIDGLSNVYDEMQRANVEPNEITYCILAKAYAMARLYSVAETYVEAIERSKTGNNWSTLDILVMLYGYLNKDKELDQTWKLIQQLPNVTPNSYMLAIEAFGKIGLVSRAEEIWAKFKSSRKINQTNEFNSILSVYCRYGIIEKATGIYKEMVANGCKPNAITYRHLTLGYLKAGMVKNAIKTIKLGECETLVNNVRQSMPWLETTYMIVEMFGHLGKLENVKLVFEELKKSKYSQHTFVYNALLKGYVEARVYEPELLERMILDGARPDAESYSLLKLIEQFKKSNEKEGS
ncbi:pentatricopeptide repeat-containing protein At1g07590, mitochondrial-like [Carex rostrata]